MQRLTRYLKNIQFFPKNKIGLFTSRLNAVQLLQGEFLPPNIPYESWIFIEEGLLVELLTRNKIKPATTRIFFQGRSLHYYRTVYDHNPLGKRILKAVEATTLYYMEPIDASHHRRNIIYSAITHAMTKDNSARQNFYRVRYSANTMKKINKIIKNNPSLFRVPFNNLCQYLKIKNVHQKKRLRHAQSVYRKSQRLPQYFEKGVTNMLSTTAMLAYASNTRN